MIYQVNFSTSYASILSKCMLYVVLVHLTSLHSVLCTSTPFVSYRTSLFSYTATLEQIVTKNHKITKLAKLKRVYNSI